MKKNEIVDLKTKTVDELTRLVSDLRNEIDKKKTDQALGKSKNTNEVRNKRKDLARVLTFLGMRDKTIGKEPAKS